MFTTYQVQRWISSIEKNTNKSRDSATLRHSVNIFFWALVFSLFYPIPPPPPPLLAKKNICEHFCGFPEISAIYADWTLYSVDSLGQRSVCFFNLSKPYKFFFYPEQIANLSNLTVAIWKKAFTKNKWPGSVNVYDTMVPWTVDSAQFEFESALSGQHSAWLSALVTKHLICLEYWFYSILLANFFYYCYLSMTTKNVNNWLHSCCGYMVIISLTVLCCPRQHREICKVAKARKIARSREQGSHMGYASCLG